MVGYRLFCFRIDFFLILTFCLCFSQASSSEALAGASVYAVHTNKLFDGDSVGAVSLVLDGGHYHVFVPDKDVCVAHQVDHEDVMKHGGAFPPIVCLPIVAANEWWGAVTKGMFSSCFYYLFSFCLCFFLLCDLSTSVLSCIV